MPMLHTPSVPRSMDPDANSVWCVRGALDHCLSNTDVLEFPSRWRISVPRRGGGQMPAMQVTAEAALRYPLTFAPFTIKNVELRNRVIRTSMGSGIPAGGLVNDELIAFHVARARGGV